jgi:hypothetical protein
MRKVIVFAVIAMLVLLSACGGNQMTAKPLSSRTPSGAVALPAAQPEPAAPAAEPTKTAAEAIKDLKEQMANAPVSSGPKTGSTGMPPAPSGLTGKDALKARMRGLMNQTLDVDLPTNVSTEFTHYY